MITIETLCVRIVGLRREDVEYWIGQSWVHPDGGPEGYLFQEIDIARVQLIVELREQMQVNEEAMPIILSLLDQLYEARRRMMHVRDVLQQATPAELRDEVMRLLAADEMVR